MKDIAWIGRGRVRAALLDKMLIVDYPRLGTRGGRIKADMAAFFRKEFRAWRPSYAPFAVEIWIGLPDPLRKVDVDNVAKTALDALTGLVWRDDSQVVHLTIRKWRNETEGLHILAGETEIPAPKPLHAVLTQVEALR